MNLNQSQLSLNTYRNCDHSQSDSTKTQMNRNISKTQTSSKNSKFTKPTTESVSKYFPKTELKDVQNNFTAKTLGKTTLKNSNEVDPQSPFDDSADDFRSPVLLRKRNNCAWKLNKNPKQPTKPKNTGSKKRVAKNSTLEIIKKNVDGDDTNPEHLQLAIALSKSSFEAEYGHSSESQENVDTPDISVMLQKTKPTSLEKFGFKSCRSVLPVSNQKIRSSPLEVSKKIKNRYKFITPILSIRTKEDQEALINSKISQLLGQSGLKSKAKLDRLPTSSTLFNYLPKRRCIFPLDDIYEHNSFKIDCLELSNNPARCGCLLKDWSSIPGRDKSPVKLKIVCQKSESLSTDSISYRANSPEILDSSTMSLKNQDSVHTSSRGLSPDIFGSEEHESSPKISLDFSKEKIKKSPEKIKNINEKKAQIIDMTDDNTEPKISKEKISSSLTRVASFYSLDEFEIDAEMEFGKNGLLNDVSNNSKMEIDVPASCNRLISDIDKIRTIPSIDEKLNSSLDYNGDEGKNENLSIHDPFNMEVSRSAVTKFTSDKNRSSNCNSDKSETHFDIAPVVELDDHESSHYSYLTCLTPEPVKGITNSSFTNHNSPQNGKYVSNNELDCKFPAPSDFEDTEIMTEEVIKPSPKTSFQELEYWDFEMQFHNDSQKEIKSYKKTLQSPSKDATCIELSDDSFSEDQINLGLNKSLEDDQKCASNSAPEVITETKTSEGTQSRVTSRFGTDVEVHFGDQTDNSLKNENKVPRNTFCSPEKQNMVSITISDELFSNEQQEALNPNKTLNLSQVQAPISPLAISSDSNNKFSICRSSRGYNSADLNVTDYVNNLLSKDNYSFENCAVATNNDHSKEDEHLSWSQGSSIEDEELNYSCYFTRSSPARRYKENESDLDDDEIYAVSEKMEESAIRNEPTLPSNSPQKIKVINTPENYIIKTRNITPIPDFDSMTTPLIHKELHKVGVKPLKRDRGTKLLKYIYESTHPVVDSVDFVEKCGSDDEGKVIKRRKRAHGTVQKTKSVCDIENSQEASAISNMEVIYSEADIIGDRLLIDEKYEDLVFERQSSKIPSCPVPLQIIWYNFLCCNADIKEKVLLYEPLQLETLHSMLKGMGFKFHIQDLLNFLDKKCITVRTDRKRAKT
ncbi:structure-specific endonuclease subunit SLX4 [Euwallacea similis]|uniref:structure-specific endonuclease subunit SLX4 n=1 Tax=Euwallacea similis TaxID=1736056 RepID=UPI00344E0E77